jgi:hypothetical protein
MTDRLSSLELHEANVLRVTTENSLRPRQERCLRISAEDFDTCERLMTAFERLAEARRPQPRPMKAPRVLPVRPHDRAGGFR